jgi:formamidopyrimidine-DNA glycosylase
MPELPEVYHIAKQMNEKLKGKSIAEVEVLQEKCLNMPLEDFKALIMNKPIEEVYSLGKWLFTRFQGSTYLLISLGMGGDVIYHEIGEVMDQKYQFKFTFEDGCFVHVFFSWFGYVHAADEASLKAHKMTGELGISPLSEAFTYEIFRGMLKGKKGGIKAYLMNQHNIAGIGNVYIQDILFKSKLHPNRKISELHGHELKSLYDAITEHLRYAADLGGLIYERDFYGKNGGYTYDLVGHKPGKPCPACGTTIVEIKTGSTRSYICEACQK